MNPDWLMKNLLSVQIISALSLGSVTIAVPFARGKFISETFRLFETFIVKMAFTSVDDFQAAEFSAPLVTH